MTKSEKTQEKIIKAYLKLCHSLGVEAVTLQMIAQKSKLSFGTIHYHYGGDRNKVRLTALEYTAKQGRQYTLEKLQKYPTKDSNKIRAYYLASIDWIQKVPEQGSYWVYFYFLASTDKKIRKIMSQARETALDRLDQFVREELMSREILKTNQEVRKISIDLHNYLVGSVILLVAQGRKFAKSEEKEAFTNFPKKYFASLLE